MNPEDFKLQGVSIHYEYAESPIFLEKAALAVNRHLHEFARFVRRSTGFLLSAQEPMTTVRLVSDATRVSAESVSSEELALLLQKVRDLMRDLFEELEFANVSDVYITCRYFRPMDSISTVTGALIGELMRVPDPYATRFDSDPVDFQWGLSFPLTPGLECKILVFVARSEQEVKSFFPRSADECGTGGVGVRLQFGFPPETETVSLEQAHRLFAVVQKETPRIASMVIQSIRG